MCLTFLSYSYLIINVSQLLQVIIYLQKFKFSNYSLITELIQTSPTSLSSNSLEYTSKMFNIINIFINSVSETKFAAIGGRVLARQQHIGFFFIEIS